MFIYAYMCVYIFTYEYEGISVIFHYLLSGALLPSHRCCLVLVFFFIALLDFEITSSVSWPLASPLSISELWPGSLMSLPWLEIPE